MKVHLKVLASSCLLLPACFVAHATPIAAGGTVLATPITSTPTNILSSINAVAYTSQAPAGMASTFQGTYSAAVYADSSNMLCTSVGNCLTIAIQVYNSSTSTDGIETVTTGPFGSGFTYQVGYLPSAVGTAPLVIKDSTTGTISFNFTSGGLWASIMPGFRSDYLIIQTSATNYTAGNISFQDNQTATVAGFIPALAITPEPGSLVLLGSGLLATAFAAMRRRARLV